MKLPIHYTVLKWIKMRAMGCLNVECCGLFSQSVEQMEAMKRACRSVGRSGADRGANPCHLSVLIVFGAKFFLFVLCVVGREYLSGISIILVYQDYIERVMIHYYAKTTRRLAVSFPLSV